MARDRKDKFKRWIASDEAYALPWCKPMFPGSIKYVNAYSALTALMNKVCDESTPEPGDVARILGIAVEFLGQAELSGNSSRTTCPDIARVMMMAFRFNHILGFVHGKPPIAELCPWDVYQSHPEDPSPDYLQLPDDANPDRSERLFWSAHYRLESGEVYVPGVVPKDFDVPEAKSEWQTRWEGETTYTVAHASELARVSRRFDEHCHSVHNEKRAKTLKLGSSLERFGLCLKHLRLATQDLTIRDGQQAALVVFLVLVYSVKHVFNPSVDDLGLDEYIALLYRSLGPKVLVLARDLLFAVSAEPKAMLATFTREWSGCFFSAESIEFTEAVSVLMMDKVIKQQADLFREATMFGVTQARGDDLEPVRANDDRIRDPS